MDNPSRSVGLIEDAIDRLIEYGDRIHAAYRKQHPEILKQKLEIANSLKNKSTRSVRSQTTDIRTASSTLSTTTGTTTCSSCGLMTGERSGRTSERREELSEQETVNNYLYTVTKGGRRCTIPGKMYSRRLPDSWVALRFLLYDEDGQQLLDLRTEIKEESLRNTVVNGKHTDLIP